MENIYTYTGSMLGNSYSAEFVPMQSVSVGQDGTVLNGRMFRFNADGSCRVYNISDMTLDGEFILDKSDLLKMHCNAVDFSDCYYKDGDEYPLIYTNVYNSYSKCEDRQEGVCGVYRIVRNNSGGYNSTLIQIIRIAFTDDEKLWCSPGHIDVRPYGNFVVDRDGKRLIAFTMRDTDYHTRVFSFKLPDINEGVFDEYYGVNLLMLTKEDILDSFNIGYSNYIQGACCVDGKVYSTEGFTGPAQPAGIRIFDLNERRQTAYLPLFSWKMKIEPEFIAGYEDGFIYSDANGNVWKLTIGK